MSYNFLKISPDSRSTAAGQSQINGRTRVNKKICCKQFQSISYYVKNNYIIATFFWGGRGQGWQNTGIYE